MKPMEKKHYSWWPYVKFIIQAYPERNKVDQFGVALREWEAVENAVSSTKNAASGADRLTAIKLMHWDRTHTLNGAAEAIHCDRSTVARWQRAFFEDVARNRDLLD